ncbi:hypothetical protein WJX72_008225 [[Myrmecia] bisecta]|uniref:AAA+ ATPase domain-containing protein n=1 Tax=[Myrmecia] bisecta TaxID=41462 RepID=A0AAW1QAI6_9CHLO
MVQVCLKGTAHRMAYPKTWDDIEAKLKVLYPKDDDRGRVRKKLLDIDDDKKALRYFQDSDASVKAALDDFLTQVRRAFPAQYGTGREGLSGRGYTTRRTATCGRLYQLVGDRGYLLIKAPPQSGKTSTLQLLMDWASREHPGLHVVYINLADERTGFQLNDVLQARLGGTLDDIINGGKSVLLCVDEVQIAYHEQRTGSTDFWNQLKRLERGPLAVTAEHDTRVVMAAAYGTKRSAANIVEPDSPASTPVNFEYPDMVLQLGDLIKDHVGSISAWQVGLLTVCLDYLKEELVNELRAPDAVNRNAWYKLTSRGFLSRLLHVRSIMKYEDVERIPAAVALLRQLLWVEPLAVNFPDDSAEAAAVYMLCRVGQIILQEDQGADRLMFTSPLHRASFLHRHYSGTCTTSAEWSMSELIIRAVERMDPAILQKTESLGSDNKRLERCWQMELYRVFLDLLPRGRVVSPDVGRTLGGRGFADFYISEPECIVLEATRDGKDMTKHLNRLLDPHKYQPLLENGGVKQHAVVDFRSPGSPNPRMTHDHLYNVLFSADFSEAVVCHMGERQRVVVAGAADEATRQAFAAAVQ